MPVHVRGNQKTITPDYLEARYGEQFRKRIEQDPDAPDLTGPAGTIYYDPEVFAKELEMARKEGFDSVRFLRVSEGMGDPSDQIAVLDPANIRSTNARFNPRYRSSTNLLLANPD